MDLQMPRMDGYQAKLALDQHGYTKPVVSLMIRLADGRYKKYANPLLIEFDRLGLAQVVPYGYYQHNGDSTPIYDGCDLKDFSKVEKKIQESASMQMVIRDNKIDLAPGSITVTRIEDYKYLNIIYHSLPTFAVNFKDVKGDQYSIEMLRGSESMKGVTLQDTAYLKIEKLANGTVNRFCTQYFYPGEYSSSQVDAQIKNITKNFTYPLVKLALYDVTESH
jgi:hypothetical protein